MPTIIEYSDRKPAKNLYPRRIVSPMQSNRCCFSDMESLGPPMQEGDCELQYKRCRTCGFTVRLILRRLPDPILMARLRKILQTAFARDLP